MRCEKCKASVCEDYECGAYGYYIGVPDDETIGFSDGECGCNLHWKTIKKAIKEKDSCYEISLAEGQKMCNPEKYDKLLKKVNSENILNIYIEYAKHCVGLDYHKPYRRNGKMYFRPYRNYFNTNYDDEVWSDLRFLGYAECDCNYWDSAEKKNSVFFWLNEDGRKWLAEMIGIFKIWEERD